MLGLLDASTQTLTTTILPGVVGLVGAMSRNVLPLTAFKCERI